MFYSQTILARKGPLGTVWCAAHLQHRLKKSHYAATHIPSAVERIMYPEVPIALRMYGHLLLGVVRIYAKKLDYLYQDCNVLLIGISKAFAPAEINLPEDANQAQFDAVTLPIPNNFALDQLPLDEYDVEGFRDTHLKSRGEITITDGYLSQRNAYISITLSEEEPTYLVDASGSMSMPMEEDSHPPVPLETTAGFQDPGPSHPMEVSEMPIENSIQESDLDIHIMRDAVHHDVLPNVSIWPDRDDDVIEPDADLVKQFTAEKQNSTPALEDTLIPTEQTPTCMQDQRLHPAVLEQGHENSDPQISLELASPKMAIQSTPHVERPRARRRKRQYDEKTVLTNKFMKKSLEDSSDLLRAKNTSCSLLDCWKSSNMYKKERVFLEPAMTGLSSDLSDMFNNNYILKRASSISMEELCVEPSVSQCPGPMLEPDVEVERPRNFEGPGESSTVQDIMYSPDRYIPSPSRLDDLSPSTGIDLGPKSNEAFRTGILPTPDLAASTGSIMSEMETPLLEQPELEKTGLSEIPELENSGELSFLEEDDTTPGLIGTPKSNFSSGEQNGTPEAVKLSARTWAVGKYLEKKSSVFRNSEDLYEDVSLNKILGGKRRKVCARAFYETLVLKSYDCIEVRQVEPYGDITLKATDKLKKVCSS